MSVIHRFGAVALSVALPGLLTGTAHAQGPSESLPDESATSATNAQCGRAYEQGQEQRNAGQLLAARTSLQVCAQDQCPDFVHADCLRWYEQVQNEVPTVVFAVRSRGVDVSEVRISIGPRLLSTHNDGQPLELDPGGYDFSFVAPNMQPHVQKFTILRGERNRLLQIELEPLAAKPVGNASSESAPRSRSLLLPGVLAGVGAVGIGTFVGLGVWGRADETRLAESCRGHCREDQVSEVKTKYLLADVSLGVGVASLALGAYFFFASAETSPPARAARVDVQASATGVGASYGGVF